LPARAERVGIMPSKNLSVVRSVGRFGDVFFNVVDADGWTVMTYLESEGGELRAKRHAETGRARLKGEPVSGPVAALFR
jgi:hypothetical protein